MDSFLLKIGPFYFSLCSNNPAVIHSIDLHYTELRVDRCDFVDFHLDLIESSGQLTVIIDYDREYPQIPVCHGALALEWAINHAIYQSLHHYLILHAAVLVKNGKAVLFPADSGSGKSTLSAALMLSGWTLYTDELALLEGAEPLVHCLPKPVNLKNGSVDLLRARSPGAVFGGLIVGTEKGDVRLLQRPFSGEEAPTRIAGLVFVKWQAGVPAEVEMVDARSAFERVIGNAVNYVLKREEGFDQVCSLVNSSKAYALDYSDLDEAIAILDELFDA